MHEIVKNMLEQTALLERFLRYVRIDTQANPASNTVPSNPKERDLAELLAQELGELGVKDVTVSQSGYVYAHLPANCPSSRRIAFLAHMDVAPDCCGEGVKPVLHERFSGKRIQFATGDVLTSQECPDLELCCGHTLVTSDGTTLLGADDKAGVAAIMSFVEYLQKNPQAKRPNVTICFTPDEEIGRGVDHIELEKLNAELAYTVDGHLPGEVSLETFTAWGATLKFVGKSHHPGDAKNNMVNAARMAAEFVARLPQSLTPEHAEGREPFVHVTSLDGNVELATVTMILRGFSKNDIDREKAIIDSIVAALKAVEPRLAVQVEFREQYRNMGEVISAHPLCRDILFRACARVGVEPVVAPIRGGTDGARLSFMGVPTPNLFTGGKCFHSTREWVSVDFMAVAAATLVAIANEATAD